LPLAICFLSVDFDFKTLVDLFQLAPLFPLFAHPYPALDQSVANTNAGKMRTLLNVVKAELSIAKE
jgi:hypothetical protein